MNSHVVPPIFDEWTCLCGARAAGRQNLCRKCRARTRWERTATYRAAARALAEGSES